MKPVATREELRARLMEELKRPSKPEIISYDEYVHYQKLSTFKCPLGRIINTCDGTACPMRPDDPFDDYFRECSASRRARIVLDRVLNGKTVVVNGSNNSMVIPL